MNGDVLVQDFVAESSVFYFGVKSLNVKSVLASRNKKERVVLVVARHLCREIRAETCLSSDRIDPRLSLLNYSLLPGPMTSAHIVELAVAAMDAFGICRLRADQVMAIELVFSLPPSFKGDQRAFFADALLWTRTEFPHPISIVAAYVHLDEATPHMHVLMIPIIGPGRMSGHKVAGFKGVYNKRINSFHKQVASKYGLGKPRRKGKPTNAERRLLGERVLTLLMADGPAWASSPAAVAAMRKTLIADPMPMARALGLLAFQAAIDDVRDPVHSTAEDANTTPAENQSAYLCYAVAVDMLDDDSGEADQVRHNGRHAIPQPTAYPVQAQSLLVSPHPMVLPAYALTGACDVSPAVSGIITLSIQAGHFEANTNSFSGGGNFIVERDDFLASEWDPEKGERIKPVTKGISQRALADEAVQAVLAGR